MQVGVILAGGLATRLPNKVLLPTKSGFAIQSSVKLLRRSKVDEIVIVVPPNSVIPDIMGNGFLYATQEEAKGVPDAINRGRLSWSSASGTIDAQFLVSCADNVYDEDEVIHDSQLAVGGVARASVRFLPPFMTKHLARYSPKKKHFVSASTTDKAPSVAGVMSFYGPAFVGAADTVQWLNAMKAEAQAYDAQWWDIGTVETYTAYWRTPCAALC